MYWHGMISENWAYELCIWGKGWNSIVSIDLNIVKGGDHQGLFTCWVFFGKKLFEFNVYDIRHDDDDEEDIF